MKTEQPAGPVRLSVNAIIAGRWFGAGEALPFETAAALPDPLKPFIAEEEPDEPPGPAGIRFEPGQVYNIDDRGAIITRHGHREAGRLAAEAAWQEAAEEEALRQGELPEETRAGLQAEHDTRIGAALANAESAARNRAAVIEAAQQKNDAEEKPADPFYVRRGGAWMRAERARLRPAEQIFVKRPTGAWEAVGVVDASGNPPPPEVIS